jgi:hypothetical protein
MSMTRFLVCPKCESNNLHQTESAPLGWSRRSVVCLDCFHVFAPRATPERESMHSPPGTPIADFACITCRTESVAVVTMIGRFIYLRCDRCGELWAVPQRRGVWPHAFPSPNALDAHIRRENDEPLAAGHMPELRPKSSGT